MPSMNVITLDTTKLDYIIRTEPAKAVKIIRETAFEIEKQAKIRAPRDPQRPPEDLSQPVTGNLRSYSAVEEEQAGFSAIIAFFAEYAIYQELGFHAANGRLVGPRPFLKPAVEKLRSLWEDKDTWAEIVK